MRAVIADWIVTGDTPVSYWPFFTSSSRPCSLPKTLNNEIKLVVCYNFHSYLLFIVGSTLAMYF